MVLVSNCWYLHTQEFLFASLIVCELTWYLGTEDSPREVHGHAGREKGVSKERTKVSYENAKIIPVIISWLSDPRCGARFRRDSIGQWECTAPIMACIIYVSIDAMFSNIPLRRHRFQPTLLRKAQLLRLEIKLLYIIRNTSAASRKIPSSTVIKPVLVMCFIRPGSIDFFFAGPNSLAVLIPQGIPETPWYWHQWDETDETWTKIDYFP